jgi:hypothetical protein
LRVALNTSFALLPEFIGGDGFGGGLVSAWACGGRIKATVANKDAKLKIAMGRFNKVASFFPNGLPSRSINSPSH